MIAWVVDTAIAVSLLIAAVLLIRRPFAVMFGARAAYALWLAPALRAVTPPLTFPSVPVPAPALSGAADYVLVTSAAAPTSAMSLASVITAFWLSGAAIFLTAHIWRHHQFLREALATARWLDIPGVPYDVIASGRIDGPMATGLTHPLILVPGDFQQQLSLDEQSFALWHEQLHHRRGDIWASAGALVLVSLLWFNPLAHLALGAFRRDMEAACDASVIAEAGSDAGRPTPERSSAAPRGRCRARSAPSLQSTN